MLDFSLITPERTVLTESVYEVILPAIEGQIAVLPGHLPVISLLRAGVISIRRQKGDTDRQLEHLATSGGFAEITGSQVKVLADTAERAEELDELIVSEARQAAERQVREAKDTLSYSDALGRLELELAREKVKNLKRHHVSKTTISTDNVN